MTKKLIITEKPSVAMEFAKALGINVNRKNGYITENSYQGIYEGLKYLLENFQELKKYKKNLKEYKYDNSAIIKSIEGVLMND